MKRSIIFGSVVVVLGLLIAFGPQFLFKVCVVNCCCADIPHCHWSVQAEIGIGLLIVSLGICLIVFPDSKTHLGLFIGIFFAGIVALFIPHTLIGGCDVKTMACRKVAFPALTIESIILVIFSVIMLFVIARNKPFAQ